MVDDGKGEIMKPLPIGTNGPPFHSPPSQSVYINQRGTMILHNDWSHRWSTLETIASSTPIALINLSQDKET